MEYNFVMLNRAASGFLSETVHCVYIEQYISDADGAVAVLQRVRRDVRFYTTLQNDVYY